MKFWAFGFSLNGISSPSAPLLSSINDGLRFGDTKNTLDHILSITSHYNTIPTPFLIYLLPLQKFGFQASMKKKNKITTYNG